MKNLLPKNILNLNSKFYFDYNMSQNIWFRTSGNAAIYCVIYDENELCIILDAIKDTPYIVLGSGSNLLIRDKGYRGIIFKLGKKFNNLNIVDNQIKVGASILDINLSKFAQTNLIKGFEFYSGIPGTVGGAIKMNAGCYGSETKDVLKEIKVINSKGEIVKILSNKLNLTYRNSKLPKDSIILSAKFLCEEGDAESISSKINHIKKMRTNSQPLKEKTSGSTFKNPKNNFAAKLIEESGCKGLNVGDAHVSMQHSNFLINSNNAKASEIEELGNRIIDKVFKKFEIKLDWEIKIIGKR